MPSRSPRAGSRTSGICANTTRARLIPGSPARASSRAPRLIEQIIATSDKQRLDLEGGRIRALYGHSLSGLHIARPPIEPPPTLYHGTPRRNLERILVEGLRPMHRQYVHLSATPEIALEVGRRRDLEPLVLAVDTSAARAAGVQFLRGNGNIYLAGHIPPECLSVIDQ